MKPFRTCSASSLFGLSLLCLMSPFAKTSVMAANPIIADVFTADPAAIVYKDKVYLYTGHDESPEKNPHYVMNEWLCYSSSDMVNWKPEGSPLNVKAFGWARGDAWASQVVERNGKFYWYAAVQADGGKGIGVAVADSPTGPFKDARGSALVTNDMTKSTGISWDDIDPTVFVDSDSQAWLFWGNQKCYYAKLKSNMTEFDGAIETLTPDLPNFTEAPWIHKRGNLYYLSYAYQFPEKIAYATAPKITGPWTYRGILAEVAGNSNTIHQAIIDFKGKSYFIYHNGSLPSPTTGGSYRRSVCIDYLYYNRDGTMKRVVQTTEGINQPARGK
jgi:beta-xylosidase